MTPDQSVKEQRLMRMTPTWHECDGQGLKRLAAAGMAWLEQNYQAVNALNVFPVPDGEALQALPLPDLTGWRVLCIRPTRHPAYKQNR